MDCQEVYEACDTTCDNAEPYCGDPYEEALSAECLAVHGRYYECEANCAFQRDICLAQ